VLHVGFAEVNLFWTLFISFAFGASLLLFLGYHFKLLLSNTTTLESLVKYNKFYQQYVCDHSDLSVYMANQILNQ
jgi:hypothetical protein